MKTKRFLVERASCEKALRPEACHEIMSHPIGVVVNDGYMSGYEDACGATGHGGLALCHASAWKPVDVSRLSMGEQSGQTAKTE